MTLPGTPQRTTPGFSFSIVERSLLDCIAERKFGKLQMAQAVEFFGPSCVYCGDTPIKRWDHLVPILQGGDTVLGNVVPACSKCDDSKQGRLFEEWAISSVPGSPRTRGIPDLEDRLSRIREYVLQNAYCPHKPAERLSTDELKQFELIHEDLSRLRKDIEGFIAMYRERTGLR
jgi:hypothetical protein